MFYNLRRLPGNLLRFLLQVSRLGSFGKAQTRNESILLLTICTTRVRIIFSASCFSLSLMMNNRETCRRETVSNG